MHPNKPVPTVRSIFKLLETHGRMWGYFSWPFSTNVFNSVVDNGVGGGVPILGLFFRGANRACTLGDTGIKNMLCGKKERSLCAIIRDSFYISKAGRDILSPRTS